MIKEIILFDVDGTLTESRKKIKPNMVEKLKELKKKYTIAIVGGSDLKKQQEQLGDTLRLFDYIFSENGLIAFRGEECIHKKNMILYMGEDNYQKLINYCMNYISKIKLPKKRGSFFELRTGMLNVSPIGRSCTYEERLEFYELDKKNNIRKNFIAAMEKDLKSLNLKFSAGGQISIDIFPIGWDKTYCLQHLKKDEFNKFYFVGDRTEPGGNDYEIFSSSETVSYSVKSPDDTIKIIDLFLYKNL